MSSPGPSRRAELLGTTIRRLLRRGAPGKISKILAKLRAEDVAVMLHSFTPSEQQVVFQTLVEDFTSEATAVLTQLEPQRRLALLEGMSPESVVRLLELAPVDDAVFLLESLPSELERSVLAMVDVEERFAQIQAHYAYSEDSAGRVMDADFLAAAQEVTVADAVERVREFARGEGLISYLYVVDAHGRLLGVTSLRQLLLSDPQAQLGDIMNPSVVRVDADTDQEEVAQLAARYDFLAIPVTDDDHRLLGIVTVDDIIDIVKEEATEDFYKMAGTTDDELVYQDRSFKVAGIRLPWILVNLGGLLGAAVLTTRFDETFQMALLVGFIPVIMGMAGNIGSQTSTIAVRGLATGRLSLGGGRIRHFLWQQIKVGTILGAACAGLVALATVAFADSQALTVAVATSLFATVLLASANGVLIPVVFQRVGFDPAVASGPLVTTLNDVLGILIYFGLTWTLLQGLPA